MLAFRTERGEYYLGDATTILKEFPDEYFDIVVTDPPFFTKERNHETGNYEDFVRALPEIYRILKKDSWFLIYFPSTRLPELFRDVGKFFTYKDRFIVDFKSTTTKGAFGDKKTLCLLVFSKGKPKINERFYTDILPGFEDPLIVTLHPRSSLWKPTLVTSLILSKFIGRKKVKLLDPFAGYGSILIVAEKFGWEWVGIDVNEEIVEKARAILLEGKEPRKVLGKKKKEK